MTKIIPFQQSFDKSIPAAVNGSEDYFLERETIENLNDLLVFSGLDRLAAEHFILKAKKDRASETLKNYSYPVKLSTKDKQKAQEQGIMALRLALLRKHTGLSYRSMSTQLALAELYQWFCHINRFTTPTIPGSSKLNYLENRLGDTFLQSANTKLISYALQNSGVGKAVEIAEPIKIDDCFFDPFCLEANIHFPVDWVLLRDASRTLILLITRMRRHVANRMEYSVEKLMRQMNNLCIQMTSAKGKNEAKKKRKQIFRKMKKLVKRIAGHARKHLEKLYNSRGVLELSEESILKIAREMNAVLMQLPMAIEQGHKRIISELPVDNKEKILSLYEGDVNIIVRNKAGKKYEYGNKISLMEQSDGLIIDCSMAKSGSPSDTKLCRTSFDNVIKTYGPIKSLTTDRGCQSKANSNHFEKNNTFDATCPRSVDEMNKKREDAEFCKLQKRRSNTEARISILKNFTGDKLLCKTFEHRKQQLSLAILTHNIWKISKMMIEYRISNQPQQLTG